MLESRIAIIVVKNSGGDFYIHKRSSSKKVFPGLYGLGAGGSIEAHESPLEGAKRELREELGLSSELKELCSFDFVHADASYTVFGFETVHDGEMSECDEFESARWATQEEVDKLALEEALCPDTKILYDKIKNSY